MSNANQVKFSPFPIFTAPEKEKVTDGYGLSYAKAIWSAYNNGTNYNARRQRDIINRKYAEGLESIQKYKDRLDLNGDTSYLNLDFSPVNRIATIVDNIVGKMMNQTFKIQCNPIDPESKSKYDDYRKELYANMFLKPYAEEIEQKTGMPLIPPNKKIPESDDEAELHLKLNYKMDASIAMEEALQFVFSNNGFEDVRRKILKDLIVIKRACIYRYYNENNDIKVEYADPVDLITPYTKHEDFRGITYQAFVKQYTIEQIAQMNPSYTDEQLVEIAKTQQGRNGNPQWNINWATSYDGYYQTGAYLGTRPYYNFNIPVMEFYFLSVNREVRLKKNNSKGGFFFEKKSDQYQRKVKPETIVIVESDNQWKIKGEDLTVGKAVAKTIDDAKAYFAKIKTEALMANAEVIEKEMHYRYEGKWIPTTDYIFNYKQTKNVPREKIAGSYSPQVDLPFAIFAPDIYDMENKSLVERMIPHEDQINLINLKTQQLLIKAKPPGVAINLDGMDAVVAGMGKGKPENAGMSGIEITKMYDQTGSYTFRGTDKEGRPINGRVIEPLENGIGRDFATLFAAYNNELQKMNDVIGFNSAVDASSPNVDALVGTQKMAVNATNNALRPIYFASVNLIERTAKQLALMIQDSIQFNEEAFIQAIGMYATKTIAYGKNLAFNQFAINIELLPDEEEKAQIEQQLQLGQQSGMLNPSDVIRIRQVLKEDVKAAGQLLVLLEDKNRKNKLADSQALQQQNAQVQIQSSQAASQSQAQLDEILTQNKIALISAQSEADLKKLQIDFQFQMELQKLKNLGTSTVAEINTGAKVEVGKAASEAKVITQHVANEGGIIKERIIHNSKIEQKHMEHNGDIQRGLLDHDSKQAQIELEAKLAPISAVSKK